MKSFFPEMEYNAAVSVATHLEHVYKINSIIIADIYIKRNFFFFLHSLIYDQ